MQEANTKQANSGTLSRRDVLKAGVTAGVGVSLAAPALVGFAQSQYNLVFHTFMSDKSGVWKLIHMAWMDKVEKESGGRIKFTRVHSLGLGGPPSKLYQQTIDGKNSEGKKIDLTWTALSYDVGRLSIFEAVELPFIMTDSAPTSRAFYEYMMLNGREELKGVRPLALHVHGAGLFHGRDKLLLTPDDFKGLKVRGATRLNFNFLKAMGTDAVSMPIAAVPDALRDNKIQGTVVPWEVSRLMKLEQFAPNHTMFSNSVGALYTTSFGLLMNPASYEALPADLRKVIDNNSGFGASSFFGAVQENNDLPEITAIKEVPGNIIRTLEIEESQDFRRIAKQVEQDWYKDMKAKNFNGERLAEQMRALITKHTRSQQAVLPIIEKSFGKQPVKTW